MAISNITRTPTRMPMFDMIKIHMVPCSCCCSNTSGTYDHQTARCYAGSLSVFQPVTVVFVNLLCAERYSKLAHQKQIVQFDSKIL